MQATSVGELDGAELDAAPTALERESRGMRTRAVSGADPALEEGWVDRELALEFPELRIVSLVGAGARAPHARARCASAWRCWPTASTAPAR